MRCGAQSVLSGGHRNSRTFLKEVRFLWDARYVGTGSDCGRLFVYDVARQQPCLALPADAHIVNCVAPHPSLPIVAASGIDSSIKVFEAMGPPPAGGGEGGGSIE